MSTSTDEGTSAAPRALPIQSGARADTRTSRTAVEPVLLVIEELARQLCEQLELLEPPAEAGPAMPLKLFDETRRFEANLITQALAMTGGHQHRAARLLGILPTTLHEKMKRYGIRPHH